jgi:hypothetical protein
VDVRGLAGVITPSGREKTLFTFFQMMADLLSAGCSVAVAVVGYSPA